MLFELRSYTLHTGRSADFWQAQVERGFDLVAPIQQRLVGYFSSQQDAADQVLHLYRYDSFDDWRQRLHGLYGVAALEPYFSRVRALMTAQENRFMLPAPRPELSPLWGAGRDWCPDQPPPRLAHATPDSVVEAQTTVLLPGTQPRYWHAWQACLDAPGHAEVLDADSLLGCFVTLVGRQHQVLMLRHHASADAQRQAQARRSTHAAVRALQDTVAPLIAQHETKLLRPAPLPELAPLFHPAAERRRT